MANVQRQFETFNDKIKLRRYYEDATLVEKRDRVLRTLREGIERLRRPGSRFRRSGPSTKGRTKSGLG